MPADKTANFTWDVFYKGKEGYAEHIQVGADDPQGLQDGRGLLMTWLGSIEAETLPRDKENQGRSYRPAAPKPTAVPGVTPICPVDGGSMSMRTGTKGPMTKNPGEAYAFWGCDNFPKCRGIVQV